jgi:hypothetical protein
MNVGNVAQVDKGDKKLLQEDHEAQEADFGEELTPAIAQDYSNKLKDFSSSLRFASHAAVRVTLPPCACLFPGLLPSFCCKRADQRLAPNTPCMY